MAERIVNFCPQCGQPITWQERFGKPRPYCPDCDHTVFFDPKVAVVAFVTDGDRVLLVRRMHDPGKGRWALPAGFVDHTEAPAAAAARETLEETGLIVQVDALLDVLHRPDPDGLADIIIAYRAHAVGGALCAGDDAEGADWFSAAALPDVALVTTERLIARWLAGEL